MSGDPPRLLACSDASDNFPRVVLSSLRELTVPRDARLVVWGSLSAGGAQGTGGSGAGPTSTALKGAISSKAILVASACGAAWVVAALHRAEPVADNGASPQPTSATTVDTAPITVRSADVEAPSSKSRPAQTAANLDRLAVESKMLIQARGELRQGDTAGAQRTLSRMQRVVGSGALNQERELLVIEVLGARGDAARADSLARAFIAAHPESPHTLALRRFVRPR